MNETEKRTEIKKLTRRGKLWAWVMVGGVALTLWGWFGPRAACQANRGDSNVRAVAESSPVRAQPHEPTAESPPTAKERLVENWDGKSNPLIPAMPSHPVKRRWHALGSWSNDQARFVQRCEVVDAGECCWWAIKWSLMPSGGLYRIGGVTDVLNSFEIRTTCEDAANAYSPENRVRKIIRNNISDDEVDSCLLFTSGVHYLYIASSGMQYAVTARCLR